MAQDLEQLLQLDLGPQPDFPVLVQHVNGAMDQVSRIPNMPLAGQGGAILGLLLQIRHDVKHILAELALQPIRSYNCGAREHEPLRYPLAVLLAYPPLPLTRNELTHMTAAQCQAAAIHLGLAQLPQDVAVHERRKQIAEHLGIGQFFHP